MQWRFISVNAGRCYSIAGNRYLSSSSGKQPLIVGIRRENKGQWERRVPVTPEHVAMLTGQDKITVKVQPSNNRIFSDEEYRRVSAIQCLNRIS
jgi:hypothetical protein